MELVMAAVTCLCWIPAGVSPEFLRDAEADRGQIEAYARLLAGGDEAAVAIPDEYVGVASQYNFDEYEREGDGEVVMVEDDRGGPSLADADDVENSRIAPSDLLLVSGRGGEADSDLDIAVFDPINRSLWPIGQILLPAPPLCARWMDFDPRTGARSSFVVISGLRDEIEIWPMTVREPVAPSHVLSGVHRDAVPCVSWNVLQRNLMVSTGQDGQSVVWALDRLALAAAFASGPGNICEWSPSRADLFVVGVDSGVLVYDVRTPEPVVRMWEGMSVEALTWGVGGECLVGGGPAGDLVCSDLRQPGASWTMGADAPRVAITAVATFLAAEGIFASAHEDGDARIWRLQGSGLEQIAQDGFSEGKMFALAFAPDQPTLLAMGGEIGEVFVWDIENVLNPT